MNPKFTIETVIADLDDLQSEIFRELSGENDTNIPRVMREYDYVERLDDIRNRIGILLRAVHARLADLLTRSELVESPTSTYEHEVRQALSGHPALRARRHT
jgi:hypothetical protein